MNFWIQLGLFIGISIGVIVFIKALLHAYWRQGYQQGRLDEFDYQQNHITNLLKSIICNQNHDKTVVGDERLGITKAAEYLSVSASSLRRWEKGGMLVPERTPTGIRLYRKSVLDAVVKGGQIQQKLAD